MAIFGIAAAKSLSAASAQIPIAAIAVILTMAAGSARADGGASLSPDSTAPTAWIVSPADALVVSNVHSKVGRVLTIGILDTRLSVYVWVPLGVDRFTLGIFDQPDDTPGGVPSRFELFAPDGSSERILEMSSKTASSQAWSGYMIETHGRWGIWRLAITGPEDEVGGEKKTPKARNAFRLRTSANVEPYLRPQGGTRVRGLRFAPARSDKANAPSATLTVQMPGTSVSQRFLGLSTGDAPILVSPAGKAPEAEPIATSVTALRQDDRLAKGATLAATDIRRTDGKNLTGYWKLPLPPAATQAGERGLGASPDARLFFSSAPRMPLPVATTVATVDESGHAISARLDVTSPQTANEPLSIDTGADGRATLPLLPGVRYRLSATGGFGREDVVTTASAGTGVRFVLRKRFDVPKGWYAGDLHAHTEWYDGTDSPADVVASARANGLDFLFLTEHAHGPIPERAQIAFREAAAEATAQGGILLAPGMEWTQPTYHANVLGGILSGVPAGAPLAALIAAAHSADRPDMPLVVAMNHPSLGKTAADILRSTPNVPLVELWNSAEPAATRLWWDLLDAGAGTFAETGSDSHDRRNAPPGFRRTYVYLGDVPLTVPNLIHALRAGHTVLSRGAFLDLHPAGSDAKPGDTLSITGSSLVLTVDVRSGRPLDRVEVVLDGTVAATLDAHGASSLRREVTIPAPRSRARSWLLARAWATGDRESIPIALTNPIFLISPTQSQ